MFHFMRARRTARSLSRMLLIRRPIVQLSSTTTA